MSRIAVFSDEALDLFEPFHDLPVGAVPAISIDGEAFVPMTLDAAYADDLAADDPDKAADWYTVRLVGPDATGTGIDVTAGWSRVVFRVVSAGRTDVKPDLPETLWLVVTTRTGPNSAGSGNNIDGGGPQG